MKVFIDSGSDMRAHLVKKCQRSVQGLKTSLRSVTALCKDVFDIRYSAGEALLRGTGAPAACNAFPARDAKKFQQHKTVHIFFT